MIGLKENGKITTKGNMTENEIEKDIIEWLNSLQKTFAYKVGTTGRFKGNIKIKSNPLEHKGRTDIVCVTKGYPLFIEVKKPKETPTEEQFEFASKVLMAGGLHMVVHSLDETKDKFKMFMLFDCECEPFQSCKKCAV
jgi:hypothetical protein